MIIWGSGGGSNTLGELGENDCPVCEKTVPYSMVLHYTYRHIWYIFSWVSRREYYAVCDNCGNGTLLDKKEARNLFPKDGISFIRKKGWLIGVILAALFLGMGMIGSAQDKERAAAYLEAPQTGDIYLANFSSIEGSGYTTAGKYAYGFMNLVRVQDGELVFIVSKEAYSKKKGVRSALSKATNASYDLEDPLVMSVEKAKSLYKRGVIYEIRRN